MEVNQLFQLHFLDLKGGYRFAGNPEEIFERFFGTSNPFASLIGLLWFIIDYSQKIVMEKKHMAACLAMPLEPRISLAFSLLPN